MITPTVAPWCAIPFDRPDWFFELKWRGFHPIAETDGAGGVKLYSRRHNDFKKRLPPIADALAELKERQFWTARLELDEQGDPAV